MTKKKKKENRGGYRPNARRPLKYGEATIRIYASVPASKVDYFTDLIETELKKLEVSR